MRTYITPVRIIHFARCIKQHEFRLSEYQFCILENQVRMFTVEEWEIFSKQFPEQSSYWSFPAKQINGQLTTDVTTETAGKAQVLKEAGDEEKRLAHEHWVDVENYRAKIRNRQVNSLNSCTIPQLIEDAQKLQTLLLLGAPNA